MRYHVLATILISLTMANTAVAATKAKSPKGMVFAKNDWYVIQTIDPMNDKKQCTAYTRKSDFVQGARDSLFVSYKGRGGISAYKVRLDDDPPSDHHMASDLEKKMSAASLDSNFSRLLEAKRIRIQALTILSTSVVDDVSLAGFRESIEFIRKSCESEYLGH